MIVEGALTDEDTQFMEEIGFDAAPIAQSQHWRAAPDDDEHYIYAIAL